MLDLSSVDLQGIADALADQNDYETRWLLDPQTGQIVFWTADAGIDGQTPVDLDDLDLIGIDPLPSWVWYQDMADFADAVTDERAGRRLTRAIQGKGAFRRFQDELHQEYPDLLPAWNAFRDARSKRRAVEWLAGNSLVEAEAAARFTAGHPDPVLNEGKAPELKTPVDDLADFAALDPFFRIVEQGLAEVAGPGHFFDLLAEDVVFEFVITVPGYPRRVEGRAAVAELYRPYGAALVLDRCFDLAVHHDPGQGTVVLEYASAGRVVATGAPYGNRYISVLTLRDREVVHWRDYLDPLAVFDALGWPPR